MRAVVTGQIGIDKKPYLEAIVNRAGERGREIPLFNVGQMMYAEGPDIHPGRILDLPLSRLASLRRAAVKDIISRTKPEDDYQDIIVNTHATFRWRHGLFSAFDFDQVSELQANMFICLLDNIEVVTQLLQGAFPNYSQLIPGSYDTRALVDLEEFARATKSASIFARDGSGIIRIIVSGGGEGDPGSISVESKAEELGENEGKIDAKVDGEEAKIAFNSKYLSDVLEILEETEVALETTTPSSPGVIRPIGNDSYVHVVMPMFVQW